MSEKNAWSSIYLWVGSRADLSLNKDFNRLPQVGLVGYDQWQVSSNGGSGILVDGTIELVQSLGNYSALVQ